MPLYHCTQCMHEFEYIKRFKSDDDPLCGWCGAPAYVLEEKTPLEKSMKDMYKIVDKIYRR